MALQLASQMVVRTVLQTVPLKDLTKEFQMALQLASRTAVWTVLQMAVQLGLL